MKTDNFFGEKKINVQPRCEAFKASLMSLSQDEAGGWFDLAG
jgi:hypothetical protein